MLKWCSRDPVSNIQTIFPTKHSIWTLLTPFPEGKSPSMAAYNNKITDFLIQQQNNWGGLLRKKRGLFSLHFWKLKFQHSLIQWPLLAVSPPGGWQWEEQNITSPNREPESDNPFHTCPHLPQGPPTRLHLSTFPHHPHTTKLGTKLPTHKSLGDTPKPYQNYSHVPFH
jgi:hypothetical protein